MQIIFTKRMAFAILLSMFAVVKYWHTDSEVVTQKELSSKSIQKEIKKETQINDLPIQKIEIEHELKVHKSPILATKKLKQDIMQEDFDNYFYEPKAYNEKIDFIEPSTIVNSTSEYEKDCLKQLVLYYGSK